jgi:hypothetical protein
MQEIPNASITLPMKVGWCAMVKLMSHVDVIYKIHNPELEWACCECLHLQKGFIYKH